MTRETLKYISRRIRGEHVDDTEHRGTEHEHDSQYPDYADKRISSRNTEYTNTYRAEGSVEGVFERHYPKDTAGSKVLRPIGFSENPRHSKQDFMYELEESFEDIISGIAYYSELAMDAELKGHSEYADAFYEIAKDKMSCADTVHHRLISLGYDTRKQSEIEDRYDRAKHAFRRL